VIHHEFNNNCKSHTEECESENVCATLFNNFILNGNIACAHVAEKKKATKNKVFIQIESEKFLLIQSIKLICVKLM